MSRRIILFILAVVYGLGVQAQIPVHLESLGQVVIPYNKPVKGTPIGGLSGLTYDDEEDLFYVISDDRSQHAGARFYTFRLEMDENDSLRSDAIRWKDRIFLKTAEGKLYGKGTIDPEGITLGADGLIYISTEGDPRINIPPFINGYDRRGYLRRELTIPPAYWSKNKMKESWGVRINRGFEGLATSPDGQKLYTAIENALEQDGPAADSSTGSPLRLIEYNLSSGQVAHGFWYNTDPVFQLSGNRTGVAVNGLTDLLILDQKGHILTIERNFVPGQGVRIQLYQVDLKGATDIKGIPNLQKATQSLHPVKKWFVADLADYNIMIDNFEGMTLGPELSGGGKLLLMVSDNNFSPAQQTIFTAFRIDSGL